ncbi:glycosyl transferase, partial [Lactobacillus sp. UMNPBX11]
MYKKVTAVVVTYNRKTLLKECIESLLAQTYRNLDILVIDNASTD